MDADDTLRELRPRYLARLRERIALLEKLADDGEARDEIHRLAHSMGSSAMIYGYPALSDAARKLEALCGASPDAVLGQGLNNLIAAARAVADTGVR